MSNKDASIDVCDAIRLANATRSAVSCFSKFKSSWRLLLCTIHVKRKTVSALMKCVPLSLRQLLLVDGIARLRDVEIQLRVVNAGNAIKA